jgi:hypothetical protein
MSYEGKLMEDARRFVSCWFALLRAIVREIFDEAPYERFLARHALANSRQNYAAFMAEAAAARERRPRCC